MAKKGVQRPTFTEEEKRAIIDQVCEAYETGDYTIESCCEAAGIIERTFRLWLSKDSAYSERYKKAKGKHEESWFENILKPKAMRAIERLLEERESEETKFEELAFQGVNTGSTREVKTKSVTPPNATAAIFAMKGAFPGKFKDNVEHSGAVGANINIDGLSLEEKKALEALLSKAATAPKPV